MLLYENISQKFCYQQVKVVWVSTAKQNPTTLYPCDTSYVCSATESLGEVKSAFDVLGKDFRVFDNALL